MKTQRFEFIDGLRGIAALSVVLFHMKVQILTHDSKSIPFYLSEIFNTGYLGIQIFFVLSGFVIAYSLRKTEMDFSFFTRFFIRRSLRLDPPYWATIVLTLLLAAVAQLTFKANSPFPFTSLQIFYNLTYLTDLMEVPHLLPVAWTLCIEFQFYLVFALLMILLKSLRYPHLIWGALSLFSVLQNSDWAIVSEKPITFIPYWYSFFLGCLTCWALLKRIRKSVLWTNYAMIFVCSFLTSTPHVIVSLAVALCIHIVSEKDKLHSILRGRFFQYTGKISYSLYLIHWPVGMKFIDFAFPFMGTTLLCATCLAIIFAFADLFYRCVEKPCLAYSQNRRTLQSNLSN